LISHTVACAVLIQYQLSDDMNPIHACFLKLHVSFYRFYLIHPPLWSMIYMMLIDICHWILCSSVYLSAIELSVSTLFYVVGRTMSVMHSELKEQEKLNADLLMRNRQLGDWLNERSGSLPLLCSDDVGTSDIIDHTSVSQQGDQQHIIDHTSVSQQGNQQQHPITTEFVVQPMSDVGSTGRMSPPILRRRRRSGKTLFCVLRLKLKTISIVFYWRAILYTPVVRSNLIYAYAIPEATLFGIQLNNIDMKALHLEFKHKCFWTLLHRSELRQMPEIALQLIYEFMN
jgi:hypothetical protein